MNSPILWAPRQPDIISTRSRSSPLDIPMARTLRPQFSSSRLKYWPAPSCFGRWFRWSPPVLPNLAHAHVVDIFRRTRSARARGKHRASRRDLAGVGCRCDVALRTCRTWSRPWRRRGRERVAKRPLARDVGAVVTRYAPQTPDKSLAPEGAVDIIPTRSRCGCSSVVEHLLCQGGRREFEPRHPLQPSLGA